MKKAKHEPTTKRLTVLLLKLEDFQLDLKYMQGTEMYDSDTLSRLYNYIENHKITDIIPLNFLQHTEDNCTNETYKYCAESLYRHNSSVNKLVTNKRKRGRPPKGKNSLLDKTAKQVVKQPINTTKQTDKTVSNNTALVTNTAINTKHPVLSDNTMNINPFNFNTSIDSTMDNMSDVSNIDSSRVLMTYQPPNIELYNNENPLITPDNLIKLMCKHIHSNPKSTNFCKTLEQKFYIQHNFLIHYLGFLLVCLHTTFV